MNLADLAKSVFGSAFTLSRGYIPGHDGVDLAAKEGTPIYAVASGTVEYARNAAMDSNCGANWACGGGNVININIGSQKVTQYAHLSRSVVSQGASVKKGQLIGYVGQTGNATGPHLHFGLWDKAQHKMINPTSFLQAVLNSTSGSGQASPSEGDLFLKRLKDLGVSTDLTHPITQAEAQKIVTALYPSLKGELYDQTVAAYTGSTVGSWVTKANAGTSTTVGTDPIGAINSIPDAIASVGNIITKVGAYAAGLILLLAGLYLYSRGGTGGQA